MNKQMLDVDCFSDDVFSFLRENNFIDLKLKLLFFLARHPQAKFNLDCIAHVLSTTRLNMQAIITEFMQAGLINESLDSNGYANYSLNQEYPLCNYVIKLASLDWKSIKNMEFKLISQPVMA